MVLVGRYAGVAEVLAELLRGADHDVRVVWAADREGSPGGRPDPPEDLPLAGAVVVAQATPSDPTLATLQARGQLAAAAGVVAVAWHPADEMPVLPPGTVVLRAGRVARDLVVVVQSCWVDGVSRPSPPR